MMFIQETWLKKMGHEPKIKQLTPPGYKCQPFSRPSRGGGIAVIFKDVLESSLSFSTSFPFPTVSFEAVEVVLKTCGLDITFVCIYRPPPSKKNKLKMSMFHAEIKPLLEHYNTKSGKLVLLGDLNIHFDKKTSPNTKRMCLSLSEFSLSQLVSQPTHKHGHTIDSVIVRESDNLVNSIKVNDRIRSDHFPVVFSLDLSKPTRSRKHVERRVLSSIDFISFASDAADRLSHVPDSADKVAEYNSTLRQLLDERAPLSKRLVPDRPFAPWYCQEILIAKRERRRAERLWRSTRLTVHRQIYRKHSNKLNELISSKKNSYFSSTVLKANSSKDLFSVLNGLLGSNQSSPLPSTHNMADLPDAFSSFFDLKVRKLRANLDTTHFVPSQPDPIFAGTPLDAFTPVTQIDVEKVLKEMSLKSCELDPIPASVFAQCVPKLLPFITDIINTSLLSGTFPSALKAAIVRPLLKKHNLDPNNLSNYRPVSNLSFLSKLLEKVALRQLNVHLQTNNLFHPYQSAYRSNHSTETALLRIVNDLLHATDSGKVSLLTLLDLSAAFDTIDHSILLSRLQNTFGIRDSALSWFKSYLSGRTQTVSINNMNSKPSNLVCGVPQGSVLGPVLFSLYTVPLASIINKHNINHQLYSDDTQLYLSVTPDEIDSLLKITSDCFTDIKNWMTENKLKLNDDKTEALLVGTQHKLSNISVTTLKLGETSIPLVSVVKNLGVHIDNTLSMQTFTNSTTQSCYFHLRRISSIRKYLTTEATTKLVVSLILSRFDYCNSLLFGLPSSTTQNLQRIQNSAARLILKKRKSAHITPLLSSLHWLPIRQRILFKFLVMVFKSVNNLAPSYLSDQLKPYVLPRSLRSSSDTSLLTVPPPLNLSTIESRSFSVAGPSTWNKLPLSLRQLPSLPSFKSNLKTHLFPQN